MSNLLASDKHADFSDRYVFLTLPAHLDMPCPSCDVFQIDGDNDGEPLVRNVKGSSHLAKPGRYWSRSVATLGADEILRDYPCSNTMCGNDAWVAGHIWFEGDDGVRNSTHMYLVPICGKCNGNWGRPFNVSPPDLRV